MKMQMSHASHVDLALRFRAANAITRISSNTLLTSGCTSSGLYRGWGFKRRKRESQSVQWDIDEEG